MTPEEREQLRRDLEAAGCPALARLTTFYGTNPNAECAELRSLLRREVWVATYLHKYGGDGDEYMRSLAFSSREQMFRWAESSGLKDHEWEDALYTIDAEVPDGQG